MRACPRRWVLGLAILMALALALWLAGCGGGDGGAVAVNLDAVTQPVMGDELDQPLADLDPTQPAQELPAGLVVVGDSLPAFPGSEADGPLSEYRTASEEGQRVVDGDQRVAESGSGNYPSEESDGYIIVPGGDDELSAWVQFTLGDLLSERPTAISFEVLAAPVVPGGDDELPLAYWVGTSNYTKYRWEWSGPYDSPTSFMLNDLQVRDRYVSASTTEPRMSFAVVTIGGPEHASEGNPEGLTAVRIESSTVSVEAATAGGYWSTRPHYVLMDDGEQSKGAAALDPSQYVALIWLHFYDPGHEAGQATKYSIYRRMIDGDTHDPLEIWVPIGSTEAPYNTYTDPTDNVGGTADVIPGAAYEWRVAAWNPAGYTPKCHGAIRSIELLPPAELAASDGDPTDQLVLTWTKSEGATEYRIFRDGQEPEDLVATVGDVDTYIDTDIKDVDLHSYRMKAKNDYAVSDWSNKDTGFLLLVEPVAILTGDPLDGEFPLTVEFDASDSYDPDSPDEPNNGIMSYEFQFEEGGLWFGNSDNPLRSHSYEVRQTYVARVRVTDNDDQTDICEEPVVISPNDPPVAELEATPLKGEPPLLVSFDASASHDDDGEIDHYDWDFDNDDVVDDTTAVATNEHTYETSGDYTAKVLVVDDDGEAGVAYSKLIVVNLHPVAGLTADPLSGGAPLTVGFDASDSYDPDNQDEPQKGITKYEFDFGEGDGWEDMGLNATPDHTYDEPGDYTATVRVWDDDADFDDATAEISVGDGAICFAALDNSQWGVYVMNSDGSGARKIADATNPYYTVWCPDRSKIAYADTDVTVRELFYAESDGSGVTQITSNGIPVYESCWEDNEFLLYRAGDSDGETEIYRIKYDGTGNTLLTVESDGKADRCPVLSPDGRRIAFTRGSAGNSNDAKVFVANYPGFDDAVMIADVDGDSSIDVCSSWSVLNEICFWSSYSTSDMYKVNSDGTGQVNLSPLDSHSYTWGKYSEDGLEVVFEKDDGAIAKMSNTGTGEENLITYTEAKTPDWNTRRWPKAILTADPTDGSFPLTVDFDASDSYDMDDGTGEGLGITDYEWDFDGDGVFGESDNGESSYDGSDSASHTYTTWGVYRAWVRVTDDEGDTNTAYVDIGDITWNVHTVESTNNVGRFTSITGLDGKPAIGYYADTGGDLKFARSTTATPSSSGDWQIHIVESDGNMGYSSSLAVLGSYPAICHMSMFNDYNVVFARATTATPTSGSDWQKHAPDATGELSSHCHLAVLSGKPIIAYYEAGDNGALHFAYAASATPSSGSDWTKHTVDSTNNVGMYCCLAILDGKPAISYYDSTSADLKFARATTTTPDETSDWAMHTVCSEGNVGQHSSMVLIAGKPAICYFDDTADALAIAISRTVAPSSSNDWDLHIIDASDVVGGYCTMTVLQGRAAISYHNYTDADLKLAWAMTPEPDSPSDWLTWNVDVVNNVGEYTSIAAIGGQPHISYYDDSNGDLKFARGE